MKKSRNPATKKGTVAAKPPTVDPSERPPTPTPFPVLDIRSEWRPSSTPEPSTLRTPDEEAFLKELEEKFGSKEEAIKLFSRFSAFRAQPTTISTESPAQPSEAAQTHEETGQHPEIGEQEADDRSEAVQEDVGGCADEMNKMALGDVVEEAAGEGSPLVVQLEEGANPSLYLEGGTPFASEGATPTTYAEGEIPETSEGEIPETAEGEIPETSEGEIPETPEEGTPYKSEGEIPETAGGEIPEVELRDVVPVASEERRPETERPVEVVNVDDLPEHPPVRRRTRRKLIDEVEEEEESEHDEGVEAPGSEEEADSAEERRVALQRKRKGKRIATSPVRKSQRTSFVQRYPHPLTISSGPVIVEAGSESEGEETPNFERQEIWVTKKLLASMAKFNDSRREQTYKDRSAVGKLAKSGKQYDAGSLQHIESEEEFLGHIRDIGFEWLLKHSEQEVPVGAAREFFSTFRFKSSTDPDAESISFRLFNIEHTMSVREWSLRMGLFTNDEDAEGVWDDRAYGPPRNTPDFAPQSAWESLTHTRSGTFKTSVSKGIHLTDHLLRFAQEFIGYNLMGTASASLTTTELYFTWCMSRRIKVHLGYWLAQACHQMTANPSRHMYTCHLLGAYIERNFILKYGKAEPTVLMCEPPELFSLEYFFNKGLLYMEGPEVCFYNVGIGAEKMKKEPEVEVSGEKASTEVEELKKEVAAMRGELDGARGELLAIKGSIDVLAARSSAQNDKMTDAVQVIKQMAEWMRETISQVQHRQPPRPSTTVRQPGPGSSSLQQLPPPVKPSVASHASPTRVPVSTRRPLTKQPAITDEEEPAAPAKKKLKVNRPSVPPKSGSQGGQSQN